jgi:hypothetical protein
MDSNGVYEVSHSIIAGAVCMFCLCTVRLNDSHVRSRGYSVLPADTSSSGS